MMHRVCNILIALFGIQGVALAQEITFSTPQKITAGYAKVEVLGKNSQGILVRQMGKNDDQIAAYYDNLQLRWKKTTPSKEKTSKLEEIVVYEDSLIFLYSVTLKNVTLLKAFKTNSKLESSLNPHIIDTLNKTLVNPSPPVNFVFTPDKSKILAYHEDAAIRSTGYIHLACFDFRLKKQWRTSFKLKSMEEPGILQAAIDSNGNAYVVAGSSDLKSYNNDFPYSNLHILSFWENGAKVTEKVFEENDFLLSECEMRLDLRNGNILIAGMYANETGNESTGVYFFSYSATSDSILAKRFEPHSLEFLIQLTGNNPPKKNDGFYDFRPKELIVKRDGGALLVTESESVSTESYASSNFGTFGATSGFTINYYHYDELAVFSFMNDGTPEWKQVLHKKQATEGDGGYYSSYVMIIGPSALRFLYNDVMNGQTSVAGFTLDVAGKQDRAEIFNSDRKGVMAIPRYSKQISPNEVIMPSIKRNYFQIVKVTF